MNESNIPTQRKTPSFTILWVCATILVCLVFAFLSVPQVDAQSTVDEGRQYATIIQNVYDFVLRHYVDEVDPKELYEGAMNGMLNALEDPHSTFLTEADMSDLRDTTQGSFGGVGLYITKPTGEVPDGTPPYVEVASPIEDTPGWQAGINPGDLILKIDGESTDILTMDEVLARLRGTPGTTVNLLIRRGERIEFPVTLTRAIIEVPTVKYSIIGEDIGYVRITTFTPNTEDRVREAIAVFQSQGSKALIVDLRNNYGGLLQAAIGVSDLFLEGGIVVSTKSRIATENMVYTAKKAVAVPQDMPIVVLINRGSASASEIVAGALKDRGRGYLVGEKSFGKGSVQQIYPVGSSGFKLTTARYYTPSDVNIDKVGIPPDLEVAFPELSETEEEGLTRLIMDNRIPDFVKEEPDARAIEAFVAELEASYGLDTLLLRRLIRNEQNRTIIAPIYDLEYDIQLKKAVDLIRDGTYRNLIKTTKTLKMLQEEASLADLKKIESESQNTPMLP